MDVVTLGMAKADAANRYQTPGHFANLTSRLQSGTEDAVWVNLGDSTGNDTNEWAYLTAQWLGSQFPAVTVNYRLWNDTNQNYDAATTIQTGTGARTLTVYNGSLSGAATGYSTTRLNLQAPVTPHLVTLNYGHNDTATTVAAERPTYYPLPRLIEDWFPTAGIVLIAQNPRATTDNGSGFAAGRAADLLRQQAIIDLAATEGYGLVNVLQAFLSTPNYESQLLNADGLHPSPAGSQLWAQLVQRQMSRSLLAVPVAPHHAPHRLWVPAGAMSVVEGSPTLAAAGAANAQFPAWAFDATAQQGLVATVDYPDTWTAINVYAVWSWATGSGYTAGNNTVRWAVGYSRMPTAAGTPFTSPTGTLAYGPPLAFNETVVGGTAGNSGAWGNAATRVLSGPAIAQRPIGLRVRRIAADAADTLAETAYLRGLIVERAA